MIQKSQKPPGMYINPVNHEIFTISTGFFPSTVHQDYHHSGWSLKSWWSTPSIGASTTSSKVARKPATSCSGNLPVVGFTSGVSGKMLKDSSSMKTHPMMIQIHYSMIQYTDIKKLVYPRIVCKWTTVLGGCPQGSSNHHKLVLANEQKATNSPPTGDVIPLTSYSPTVLRIKHTYICHSLPCLPLSCLKHPKHDAMNVHIETPTNKWQGWNKQPKKPWSWICQNPLEYDAQFTTPISFMDIHLPSPGPTFWSQARYGS